MFNADAEDMNELPEDTENKRPTWRKSPAGSFLWSAAQHRRMAHSLQNPDPDWTDADRTKAAELARHREFLANLIEKRQREEAQDSLEAKA
jgi:hypothetical protein